MTDSGMKMVAESIPVFWQYSEQFVNLSKILLEEKIAGDFSRDHFGFMSFCFWTEQLNHFDAINQLEIFAEVKGNDPYDLIYKGWGTRYLGTPLAG